MQTSERFRPYMSHVLTKWVNGRGGLSVEFWNGDDAWPKSVHLTYRWRGVVYWHVWFYGAFRKYSEAL